jgi:hypothetical protein
MIYASSYEFMGAKHYAWWFSDKVQFVYNSTDVHLTPTTLDAAPFRIVDHTGMHAAKDWELCKLILAIWQADIIKK